MSFRFMPRDKGLSERIKMIIYASSTDGRWLIYTKISRILFKTICFITKYITFCVVDKKSQMQVPQGSVSQRLRLLLQCPLFLHYCTRTIFGGSALCGRVAWENLPAPAENSQSEYKIIVY
jgi:hypothetical protein